MTIWKLLLLTKPDYMRDLLQYKVQAQPGGVLPSTPATVPSGAVGGGASFQSPDVPTPYSPASSQAEISSVGTPKSHRDSVGGVTGMASPHAGGDRSSSTVASPFAGLLSGATPRGQTPLSPSSSFSGGTSALPGGGKDLFTGGFDRLLQKSFVDFSFWMADNLADIHFVFQVRVC